MRYNCTFDPDRDIQKTVPDMAIDLAGAIESGVVLDTGTLGEYNDIDSPSCIIGRVRDVFDAFEAQKSILAAGRSQASPQPYTSTSTTADSVKE